MTTKFYRDVAGNYLGGFDGFQPPDKIVVDPETKQETRVQQPFVMPDIPAGAIEINTPPPHGTDTWNGTAWIPAQARLNSEIQAQIAALDLRRIRPLAEGDAVFLAKLNDQVNALRVQLK